MKRILFLFMVVVLAAGCARSPSSTASPVEEPAATQEVEVMNPSIQVIRTIDLPFIPHDIAVAADGNIFAVELGAPKVHKLDPEGNILRTWGEAGIQAGQFAFDPPPDAPPLDGGFLVVGANGNVYITDSYNNRVQVFDADGNFLEMWESFGPESKPFNNPGPISVDAQGNIYVADFQGGHVFDPDGNYLKTISAAGEVAFDSKGNLFYSRILNLVFSQLGFKGSSLHIIMRLPVTLCTRLCQRQFRVAKCFRLP
jgi:DNA-binding beta-propeller fold protein YncE